jgi:hypothetical protein
MPAVNTSNHEDANTHDKNTDMDIGMHKIDSEMHNLDMARDRRKQASVVPDERRRHIQKENSARSTAQLYFSPKISFCFGESSLYFPRSLFPPILEAAILRTKSLISFSSFIYKTHGS